MPETYLGHMHGRSGVGVVVFTRAECWSSFGAVRRGRISHRHQDTSPERPPVVELDHLFLIVLMTQDLKISGHPLMHTAEFTPSPRNDVVNLNAIGGATPHAPPSVEPQHEAAQ
jgi:hypothetical protein